MKRRTIKLVLDGETVFRLEIQGSDEIVTKLVSDVWFNSALRRAAEELIEGKIKEKTLQTIKPMRGVMPNDPNHRS